MSGKRGGSVGSVALRYAAAVVVIALATLLKEWLPDLIGRDAPVAVYLAAIMVASWFGGTAPGLLATVLAVLAGCYWFARPYNPFVVADRHDAVRIAFGALEGGTISIAAGALRRSLLTADKRGDDLAAASQELGRETEARRAAEARLRQVRSELAHAHAVRALGTLVGSVAHDFNNVLAVILGRTDLLLRSAPPRTPLHADLEELREAASRGVELTRQLLASVRDPVVTPGELDLGEVLPRLRRRLGVLVGERIHLTISCAHGAARVRIDPTRMEQLLTNLAINARDAMPEGGRLTIQVAAVTLEVEPAQLVGLPVGDYIRLTVADTGVGIPEDVRSRIFDPFFTTKPSGRGTGLGLAIVHEVVRGAGGQISVDSSPGGGTTFTTHLPASLLRPATFDSPMGLEDA